MVRFMRGNGSMASNTGQECGEEQEVTRILANGSSERQMEMECIHGSMVIVTKESSKPA